MVPELMTAINKPNITNWSHANGYGNQVTVADYPIRVFNAKENKALTIYLGLFKPDLDNLCHGQIKGFKVTLASPSSPSSKMSKRTFRVPLLQQIDIMIKAKLITTSSALRSYRPEQRECFFDSEHQLNFFKHYTRHSCMEECLANFTREECGCVKFSMPSMNQRIFFRNDIKQYFLVKIH